MFMRLCSNRIKQQRRVESFRIYQTDTLRIIAQNTGSYPQVRYAELIVSAKLDSRTAEEIIAGVIRKGGLEVTPDGSV